MAITRTDPNIIGSGDSATLRITGSGTQFGLDSVVTCSVGDVVVGAVTYHTMEWIDVPITTGATLGNVDVTVDTPSTSENVTLVNAFEVVSHDTPRIISVSPSHGAQGELVILNIIGEHTWFYQDYASVEIDPATGITVGDPTVYSSTNCSVSIFIARDGPIGLKDVNVITENT